MYISRFNYMLQGGWLVSKVLSCNTVISLSKRIISSYVFNFSPILFSLYCVCVWGGSHSGFGSATHQGFDCIRVWIVISSAHSSFCSQKSRYMYELHPRAFHLACLLQASPGPTQNEESNMSQGQQKRTYNVPNIRTHTNSFSFFGIFR